MLKPRFERNLAAISKSGTISPQTLSVGLDVEGDRTREGKRGKEMERESHRGVAVTEQAHSCSARGFGSTYRKQKANQLDTSASTGTRRALGATPIAA